MALYLSFESRCKYFPDECTIVKRRLSLETAKAFVSQKDLILLVQGEEMIRAQSLLSSMGRDLPLPSTHPGVIPEGSSVLVVLGLAPPFDYFLFRVSAPPDTKQVDRQKK